MSITFRPRVPGSEPVPQIVDTGKPIVFKQALVLDHPGVYETSERGAVVQEHHDTATLTSA